MRTINDSYILTKCIWYDCKCTFHGRKYYSSQNWNKDLCQCKCEPAIKYFVCKENLMILIDIWKVLLMM